jgi:hypothetical protein
LPSGSIGRGLGNKPKLRRTLSRAQAEAEGWFVFDEYDIEACSPAPEEHE